MVRSLVISLLIAASAASTASAADVLPKGWETVSQEMRAGGKSVVKESDVEISVNGAAIIVSAASPVQIKVFTILGRVVSETNLPAGASRLLLPAHGVYIVKAGQYTCKVAV